MRQWTDACLWRREAHLAETDGFAFLEPDEIKGMDRQDAIELEALMRLTSCGTQGFGCMPCKKRSGLSGPMGISSKLIICALPKGSFSSIS